LCAAGGFGGFGGCGLSTSAGGASGICTSASRATTGAEAAAAEVCGCGTLSHVKRTSACSATEAASAQAKPRFSARARIERPPDLLGGERHLEMRQVERVEHRQHHRRRGADGAELAA